MCDLYYIKEILERNDVKALDVLMGLLDSEIIDIAQIENVSNALNTNTINKQNDCVHSLYEPYPASFKHVVGCLLCDKSYYCDTCFSSLAYGNGSIDYTRKIMTVKCEECNNTISVSVCGTCKRNACTCNCICGCCC
jgi:hypothetical protein